MTLRSALLIAALVLAAPITASVVVPFAAMAQDTQTPQRAPDSAAVDEVLGDETPPSQLSTKQLRKRMKLLRQSIKSGSLSRPEKRERRQKLRSYREEMRARKGKAGKGEPAGEAAGPSSKRTRKKAEPQEEMQPNQPKAGKTGTENAAPSPESNQPSGENEPAPAGMPPQSDSSGSDESAPASTVSVADCNGLWNNANRNGDDVLTEEEAAPFASALGASGKTSGTEGGQTVSKPEFMDACLKGAFKNVTP